jgi:hypothetical protein
MRKSRDWAEDGEAGRRSMISCGRRRVIVGSGRRVASAPNYRK